MSQILKFPDTVSRRSEIARPRRLPLNEGGGRKTEMPSRRVPVMTGDQWNEFMKLLTPDEQQAFMADVFQVMTPCSASAATEGMATRSAGL
jgi:hypothetical protein